MKLHYVLDLYEIKQVNLKDVELCLTLSKAAVELAKINIINSHSHTSNDENFISLNFSNGIYLMHCMPNLFMCSIDFYNSENSLNKHVVDYLIQILNPKKVKMIELKRGQELSSAL